MVIKNKAAGKKPAAPRAPRAPRAAATKKAEVEHRHISELNKLDRENLEAILRKDAGAVDEVEMETLRARAAYLTTDERKKYGI